MYINHHVICLNRSGNSKKYLLADSWYQTKIWTRDLTVGNASVLPPSTVTFGSSCGHQAASAFFHLPKRTGRLLKWKTRIKLRHSRICIVIAGEWQNAWFQNTRCVFGRWLDEVLAARIDRWDGLTRVRCQTEWGPSDLMRSGFWCGLTERSSGSGNPSGMFVKLNHKKY